MLDPATRLRQAVVRGNLALTKKILARSPELWLNTDPEKAGWTNLHYASFHGHYLICFHLVSMMHRYVNTQKSQNFHNGSSDFRVCDLDLLSFDNLTVLHMPLAHQHSQTLHFLLQEFGSEKWLNFQGGPLNRTPLHCCCASRFVEGVKLLLEFGANWHLADANGDTCLHLCFAYGDMDCIEALLKYIMVQELETLRGILGQENSVKKGSNGPISARSMTPSVSQQSTLQSGENNMGTELELEPELDAARIYESRDSLRKHLHALLARYENCPNHSGQYAVSYAASFEMEHEYFTAKKKWIDRVAADEFGANGKGAYMQYGNSGAPLAHYSSIASASRASLDSDFADTDSINTDAFAPREPDDVSRTSARDATAHSALSSPGKKSEKIGKNVKPENTEKLEKKEGTESDFRWTGRKHSQSLPGTNFPSSVFTSVPAHEQRPARQHAKSFATSFRGTPLVTRPSTVSLNSSTYPISPLQVEFTSTQSRKSSFASSRSPLKNDKERPETGPHRPEKGERTEKTEKPEIEKSEKFEKSEKNAYTTPTSGSFVSSLTFSPVSSIRRQSLSAAADSHVSSGESSHEGSYKDRGPLSKFPSTTAVRHISSADSLKRNLSSPTMLANVFRSTESAPAQQQMSSQPTSANQVLFRSSRRPSTGDLPTKVSPSKLLNGHLNSRERDRGIEREGSPSGKAGISTSGSRAEADDAEKRVFFAAPKTSRSPRPSAFPTLRIRPVPEGHRSPEDEISPVRNVKSISFARVREE